jgi:hypothetical protein
MESFRSTGDNKRKVSSNNFTIHDDAGAENFGIMANGQRLPVSLQSSFLLTVDDGRLEAQLTNIRMASRSTSQVATTVFL